MYKSKTSIPSVTYRIVRLLIDGIRFLLDGFRFLFDGFGFLIDGLSTGCGLRTRFGAWKTENFRLLGTSPRPERSL